jgi:hypothetical protein
LNETDVPEYVLFDGDRMFLPGEVRENDQVRPRRMNAHAAAERPSISLADRLENTCRNVRVSGMHVLVVLNGDDSGNVVSVTGRLLDYDQHIDVLKYLTLTVEPAQLKSEAALLRQHVWPMPAPGEIVLVALDGNQQTLATKRIATDHMADAVAMGEDSLKQHKPPTRDALAMLTQARNEARKTGRRVWLVSGGPRCGPCFRLGRWMEDQHKTLEREYIIVKVLGGVDTHDTDVLDGIPRKEQSIPWHVITEHDGSVLVTSDGPLGNIGFPDSVVGIRHFRHMLDRTVQRLTSEEVNQLSKSLSPRR